MQRRWAIIALASSFLVGCGPGRYTVPREIDDPNAMRELLAKEIPQGTSLLDAQSFMETNLFACEVQRGKSYTCPDFARENFDFLRCRRTDKAGFMVVRCWNIALVLENDKVQDIYVDISYTGP